MTKTSVVVLYNQPLLPRDHPDAESEHSVVEIAEHVAKTLEKAGFAASLMALGTDPSPLWPELQRRRADVVFNFFEGNPDHPETESYLVGLLEWFGVPYTGSPYTAVTLARAKDTAKLLLKGAGLPTAAFQIMDRPPVPACAVPFPVIVKPARQDASVGIEQSSICTTQDQVAKQTQHVFARYGGPVLIEEYIPGREFNVSVIELPEVRALAPREIVLPADKPGYWSIYTYEAKWTAGATAFNDSPHRFATDLPPATVERLQQLAVQAYRLLECRDYARVDFRVKPTGEAYILEVNPNPDISTSADLTECLIEAGWTHADFLVRLVNQALSRRRKP